MGYVEPSIGVLDAGNVGAAISARRRRNSADKSSSIRIFGEQTACASPSQPSSHTPLRVRPRERPATCGEAVPAPPRYSCKPPTACTVALRLHS
eukprot:1464128-Prymnesium_polylepis.1